MVNFIKNTAILLCCIILFHSCNLKKDNDFIPQIEQGIKKKGDNKDLLLELRKNKYSPQQGILLAKKKLQSATLAKDSISMAEAYEFISLFESNLGNTSIALSSAFSALKIYQKRNIEDGIASAHSNIAGLYTSIEQFDLAISHYKISAKIFAKYDEFSRIVQISNIGEVFRLKKQNDSAVTILTKALHEIKINKFQQIGFLKAYTEGNLGMVFNSKDQLDSAVLHLNESLSNLKSENDFYSISIYTSELAKIHQKRKEYQKAEKKYHKALDLAQQEGLKEQIRDFNQLLSEFYTEQKDYKKALHHQKQFQIYQDSLVNKENVQKIEQLKAGYEIDKRETQIGILNKENNARQKRIIYLALGLGTVFLLASLLFFSRRKIRKANTVLAEQKEEISKREQEKAWLLRELNHRVKNNLQMVASLLNLQSNKLSGHPAQEAILIGKQRVEALSLVHRKLYQEGVDTCINIKDYITELILGLFHAYNANFKPTISINENVSVNIDSAIPLALIVNEIIINCLKYAYEGIENPSLNVEITALPEKRLALHIWDNGIGFDENAEMKDSLGMKIIKSLTRQLDGSVTHFNEGGAHWRLNVLGK